MMDSFTAEKIKKFLEGKTIKQVNLEQFVEEASIDSIVTYDGYTISLEGFADMIKVWCIEDSNGNFVEL